MVRRRLTDDRFIILTVAYERQAGRGPTLEWIAPELKHAGLSLIEGNHDGWHPSRQWLGLVNGPTFERFADAWHLHDENGERASRHPDGHPTRHAYTLDGMNWETEGGSPIIFATVQVWVVGNGHEARTRARHPLPCTHVG
jgi:hypothetical protein